ncbi:hypothetical protein BN1723_015407 [Verticillium longisporum]|uniref:Glycosyl hydrolase family 32 N-terminal domain-containing protein n=1 Tax=Verticillium longisporum TaxID=100787 RepID=A0A0G4MX90_VERLO|nr:hypothetical protein BN1723_015407 [Verticillium longisporum]
MSLVTTRTTAHEASTQARLPLKHHAPSYHLKARGWMNDPCGPGYNPITKTYHIFYQWNPYGCEWGNMSWGHATSQDGLRWTHAPSGEPALKPSEPYDKEGIFTGCFWPTGPHGEKDQLTVVYSSIAALPIHWTLKHIRNSEGTAAGPRLRHEFDGVLDHGSLYAPNSYVHPETQKRITIGWVREDGLPMSRCKARGWTGFLSLPRELFLSTTHNVTRGLQSPIEDIRSFKILESGSGGKTVQTLGIKPMDDLRTLRPSRPAEWSSLGRTSAAGILRERTRNQSWELDAVITVDPRQRRVGFNICQSPDGLQRTTVYFTPQTEQIVVDKSLSNTEADVDKSLLDAPFTLLYSLENGTEKLEKLRLRIFRDGDVLEVFANDRFALTTTVYCDDSCAGISWFLDDEGSHSVFDSVQLWEDMAGTQGQVPEIGQPHL